MRLRGIVPGLILAGFLLDAGLELAIPTSRLTFRGWEAAQRFPTGEGPFTPNFSYRNERSFGDLANLGNLPSMRRYHADVFSTDAWGYRATLTPAAWPIRAVILGDSFTAGAGLTDDQTLSAQMTSEEGGGVYNAGNVYGGGSMGPMERLVRRLQLKDGLVIYQHSERYDTPLVEPTAGAFDVFRKLLVGVTGYSPLAVCLSKAERGVQNGVLLPNIFQEQVAIRPLPNGEQFAFLSAEVKNYGRTRGTDIEFFARLNRAVQATGNRFMVLLVPDKYNVYALLLQGAVAAEQTPYLAALAERLRQARIPVLDLTDALRSQAAELVKEGRYNYRPDDSHWNELGVKRAADAVNEFRRLLK